MADDTTNPPGPRVLERVQLPDGRFARFVHRDLMRSRRPLRKAKPGAQWPKPSGPVDWDKGMPFPTDGNDQYGDCGEAMAAHGDNTFTGNVGTESQFARDDLVRQYLKYSPRDMGLTEDQVISLWKSGLAGNTQAVIYDAMDIDPTDTNAMWSAAENFLYVCFAFACPDAWINGFRPGTKVVWDAPCRANERNGHFIGINGASDHGFNAETWGWHVTMTPAGIAQVDASAFVVFSPRMFDPTTGLAPNGKSYQELAALWTSLGGSSQLPPGPIPAPAPWIDPFGGGGF